MEDRLLASLTACGYKYVADQNLWQSQNGVDAPFRYTDGQEIEQRLLKVIKEANDVSVESEELAAKITDWPSFYHLSDRRANLLRPLRDVLRGRIIEIGAGCGAITRHLGQEGLDVVALEGSLARARIAAARCRDLPNVAVIAAPLQDFNVELTADVVLLVGVLEYARLFFPKGSHIDSIEAMLAAAKHHLAPGGHIVIAIENQLGLKYFAGFNEDHLGIPFAGIEDLYRHDSVVTFGRYELSTRLSAAGLRSQVWWYPFPDYKVPTLVVSEQACSTELDLDLSALLESTVTADPQQPQTTAFSLRQTWHAVARNRLFGELANSFLVVAGREAEIETKKENIKSDNILAWYYGLGRRPSFRKCSILRRVGSQIVVERSPLFPKLAIKEQNYFGWRLSDETWIAGAQWHSTLVGVLGRPGWSQDDINDWVHVWWDAILDVIKPTDATSQPTPDKVSNDHPLNGQYFDATPRNLIVKDGTRRFFDLEWEARSPLSLCHIAFRGLLSSFLDIHDCATPSAGTDLRIIPIIIAACRSVGIELSEDDMARYWETECSFQHVIHGVSPMRFDELKQSALSIKDAKMQAPSLQEKGIEELVQLAGLNISGLQRAAGNIAAMRTTIESALSSLDETLCSVNRTIQDQAGRLEFDPDWYREYYDDIRSTGINPLVHYLAYGMKEGRKPRP